MLVMLYVVCDVGGVVVGTDVIHGILNRKFSANRINLLPKIGPPLRLFLFLDSPLSTFRFLFLLFSSFSFSFSFCLSFFSFYYKEIMAIDKEKALAKLVWLDETLDEFEIRRDPALAAVLQVWLLLLLLLLLLSFYVDYIQ